MNNAIKTLNKQIKIARKNLKEEILSKDIDPWDEHGYCYKEKQIARKKERLGAMIYIRALLKKEENK